MFCPHCGKELPEGSKFCPACGKETAPAKKAASPLDFKDPKTLLGVAVVVILLLLAVLVFRSCGSDRTTGASKTPALAETLAPTPAPDPAELLVGTWTNKDGVGVTFTKDGTMQFKAKNISLGADKFKYSVDGENTLTLTPEVSVLGLSVGIDAQYAILGNTLYLGFTIGNVEYNFELTRK